MKNILIKKIWLVAVACAAIGCSDNESLGGEVDAQRCQGRLGVDGVASAAVVSRAETGGVNLADLCGFQVPNKDDLKLTLTGNDIAELESGETGPVEVGRFDYAEQWAKLADYDEPALYPGTYTALLEYGTPDAIGPAKPYYRGEAQATVVVGEKTPCNVVVAIANSAVRITADDWFKNYFSDVQLRLVIDGKETDYGLTFVETEDGIMMADADAPIFVPAGTKVAVKGSVRRPAQTGEETKEELEKLIIKIDVSAREMRAGTLHTFQFTAQAGGAHVEVEFKDFGEGSADDVELNDDAIRDEPAQDEPTPDSGAQNGGSQDGGAPDENTPAE